MDQCGYKPLGVSFIDFVKKMFGLGRLVFIGGDDRRLRWPILFVLRSPLSISRERRVMIVFFVKCMSLADSDATISA